jgi:hypothetical protein
MLLMLLVSSTDNFYFSVTYTEHILIADEYALDGIN